jgi:hypothetical protein
MHNGISNGTIEMCWTSHVKSKLNQNGYSCIKRINRQNQRKNKKYANANNIGFFKFDVTIWRFLFEHCFKSY